MHPVLLKPQVFQPLPTHLDLPETDGSVVDNFQEHPQAILLTDAMGPVLRRLHPDDQFIIGQDSGIYWRNIDPPLRGCKSPDWYVVQGVPKLLDGRMRRSYVLWQEYIAPTIILEFASRDGAEERDRTPLEGKLWVYEQVLRTPYYGIFLADEDRIEMYHLVDRLYQPMPANEQGRYAIPPLQVELGVWHGNYMGMDVPWMRFWDTHGNLIPVRPEIEEQAKLMVNQEKRRTAREKQRADEEKQRADEEKRRADLLAEKLRSLGVDPDEIR